MNLITKLLTADDFKNHLNDNLSEAIFNRVSAMQHVMQSDPEFLNNGKIKLAFIGFCNRSEVFNSNLRNGMLLKFQELGFICELSSETDIDEYSGKEEPTYYFTISLPD